MYWTRVKRGQGVTHSAAEEVETRAEAIAWCRGVVNGWAAMDDEPHVASYHVSIFDAKRDRVVLDEWVPAQVGRQWTPDPERLVAE